jgi:polyhydroxyalkanoate synthesis regulator protein
MEIVRYKNRKLYVKEFRNYTTLTEIEENLKAGKTINVVCHKTKNDITEDTLLQIAMLQTYNRAGLMKLIIDGGYTA